MRQFCGSLVLMFLLSSLAWCADHTKDTTETVKKNLAEKKAVLLDVRDLDEWKDGHLKDAQLMPYTEMAKKLDEDKLKKLVPDKKTIIYTHCAAGRRALKAGELLEKLGYDVRPLKSGFNDLVEAGLEKAKEEKSEKKK